MGLWIGVGAGAEVLLEALDDNLMGRRDRGLRVEGFKSRSITTVFEDVRIRRRMYRDRDGKRCSSPSSRCPY